MGSYEKEKRYLQCTQVMMKTKAHHTGKLLCLIVFRFKAKCFSNCQLFSILHTSAPSLMLSWKRRRECVVRKSLVFGKNVDDGTQYTREYTAHCRLRHTSLVNYLSLSHTNSKEIQALTNLDMHRNGTRSFCWLNLCWH